MRIPRTPNLTPKTKLNPLRQSDINQTLLDSSRSLRAIFGFKARGERNRGAWSVGIEIVREPDESEGVVGAGWVGFFVEGDGFFEALFADVALVMLGLELMCWGVCGGCGGVTYPWADDVGDDFDFEICHGLVEG